MGELDVLAQYTNFIRPEHGFEIIGGRLEQHARGLLAERLVLVTTS